MNGFLSFVLSLFIGFSSPLFANQPLATFSGMQGKIDIAGGTAHIPVMLAAAKTIIHANPHINITVTGGGSGVGVKKVGEGLVDIGNTGRAVKQSEIDKYGLVSFPFAIDGVAVVVNKANRVTALSRDQLSAIVAGKINNWQQLGGENAKITLYVREDGSGTRDVFEDKALNKGTEIAQANVVNSNGAMKTAIMQDKNAIGYVGIGHLDDSLNGVTLDGMVPSQQNAADGRYQITRLLYMNTRGQPHGLTQAFINFIYSPQGAVIIQQSGYLPVAKSD